MKAMPLSLFLFAGISLSLNVALGLAYRQGRERALHTYVPAQPKAELISPREAGSAELASDWRAIDTYRPLIARLETTGLPPATIAATIRMLVLQRESFERLQARSRGSQYWRLPAWEQLSRTEQNKQSIERARQREELLENLLGRNYLASIPREVEMMRATFGPFPAAKLLELRRLDLDYAELRANIYNGGALDEAARRRHELLTEEHRADARKLLAPEELFEYDLRHSALAEQLRARYRRAALTEAEYRALFSAFRSVDTTGADAIGTFDQEQAAHARLQLLMDPKRVAEIAGAATRHRVPNTLSPSRSMPR